VAGSMVTIGKYLTPELFICFGQSLFTNTSQARLRYNISRRWEFESVLGEESGADLYYKIEYYKIEFE
jgi:translocation and assembly module TamB